MEQLANRQKIDFNMIKFFRLSDSHRSASCSFRNGLVVDVRGAHKGEGASICDVHT